MKTKFKNPNNEYQKIFNEACKQSGSPSDININIWKLTCAKKDKEIALIQNHRNKLIDVRIEQDKEIELLNETIDYLRENRENTIKNLDKLKNKFPVTIPPNSLISDFHEEILRIRKSLE